MSAHEDGLHCPKCGTPMEYKSAPDRRSNMRIVEIWDEPRFWTMWQCPSCKNVEWTIR
jgi:hypothetical protein